MELPVLTRALGVGLMVMRPRPPTQRHQPLEPDRYRALREELHRLSRSHPTWGIGVLTPSSASRGWTVNRKAIQRLWREEGLRVPTRRRKRQRLGVSTTRADRLAAEHPNHVWALDYQFDQTQDGRILKLLTVVDEHTREARASGPGRSPRPGSG